MFAELCGHFDAWGSSRERSIPSVMKGFFASPGMGRLVTEVDALRFATIEDAMQCVKPGAVVNCIGMIRQLPGGSDPVASIELNSLFPHRLAALCSRIGARLIHVSTDCVFSGARGRYSEADPPDASDLYGRTKALGEPVGRGCLTIRTSIIGRELVSTTGLLEWFLSMRGGSVRGYRRAIWSGLTTRSLSVVVATLLESHPDLSGLYHVAANPLSKFDLLVCLRDRLALDIDVQPADEPMEDRSLDGSRFQADTRIEVPVWPGMAEDIARDLAAYDEWRRR